MAKTIYFLKIAFFLAVITISGTVSSHAQTIKTDENGESEPQTLRLPYIFYNEAFGLAGGYVYGLSGNPQPQSSILGTVIAGTSGSATALIAGYDLTIPDYGRLFFDPLLNVGYYNEQKAYSNGNPDFTDERSGSNDSHIDNHLVGNGWDNQAYINIKYVLPIGHGKDEVISTYKMDRGIPTNPRDIGEWWNPLAAGKTYAKLRPFYHSQTIDTEESKSKVNTNGVDAILYWDNRDFLQNPSTGHSANFKVSQDFGMFNSTNSWTVLQMEVDKYFDLGSNDLFRQQVLALDFWTVNSPSWEADGNNISNNPPSYAGATLGGLWRMRAHSTGRFNDKAGIYYAAELRMMPQWNPFPDWPVVQEYVGIDWLQVVPFVEVGRVAEDWDLAELHSDMNWDAGIGLRAWASGFVVRLDVATSDESTGVQMMIGQPFQF